MRIDTNYSIQTTTQYVRRYGVLAHQGGWDEIVLVAGPIALIVLVLWRATIRVTRPRPAEPGSVAPDVGSESGEMTD